MVEQVGPHRVRCGSVTDGLDDLLQGQRPSLFYCDPPWGPGMVKSFETMTLKATGQAPRPVSFESLLMALGREAMKTQGPVFIEMGRAWSEATIGTMVWAGLRHIQTIVATYHGGQPMHLLAFATPGHPFVLMAAHVRSIEHASGLAMVKAALGPWATAGGILLDPCCGYGNSAKAALHYHMRFYGNELNPARLARAVMALRRGGGG